MKKLTASVVGAGVGGKLSMTALARSERFELVGVADLRPSALAEIERAYPGIATFADYREMFQALPTDVVCVSTYATTHEQITLDALTLPLKGILVEKPISATHAAALRTLEAIKTRGIPAAVPHGLLAQDASRAVIEMVRSGEIGLLELVEIQCAGWDILNAGIHWINFFAALTGNEPIATVMAALDGTGQTIRDGMKVETDGVTYAETASGIRMVLQTGNHVRTHGSPDATLFRIVGSHGQIRYYAWAGNFFVQSAGYPAGETIVPAVSAVTGHQKHLENMAEMIETGRRDYSVAESSLMALEIIDAAYLSAKHHCQVRLPLNRFEAPAQVNWQLGQPASEA